MSKQTYLQIGDGSAPGFRIFLAIAARWGLNEDSTGWFSAIQILRPISCGASERRDHTVLELGVKALTRISAALGIYQALEVLLTSEQEGLNWLQPS